MKFGMCNEFCEGWPLSRVFDLAKDVGYDGVEIAPATIAKLVTEVSPERRAEIRREAEGRGLEIIGLHWLFVSPSGLHISHPIDSIRESTLTYFRQQIRFCRDLGGHRMIIGSPKQRNVLAGETYEATWARTVDFFRRCKDTAAENDVILCIEPLSPKETNFINTKNEAVRLIEEVNLPNFRLILDCNAMSTEGRPIGQIIHEAAPYLAHVHANDPNLRGPGFGDLDFRPIGEALKKIEYDQYVSVEVFDMSPDPETIARKSYEYMQETLA